MAYQEPHGISLMSDHNLLHKCKLNGLVDHGADT
jgi:hypothetical protein